jgi:hypothetical protein
MTSRLSSICFVAAAAILCLRGSVVGAASTIKPIARFDDETTAFSGKGQVPIQLREVRVGLPGVSGTPMIDRILILFEPQSGVFLWEAFSDYPKSNEEWQARAFKEYRATFLKEGHLFSFSAGRGPGPIYIQESSEKASSLGDAESKALIAAEELNHPSGSLDAVPRSHIISLANLKRDFIIPPMDAGLGETPRITNVRWTDMQWVVLLQARWVEEVSFDADYKLITMRKAE